MDKIPIELAEEDLKGYENIPIPKRAPMFKPILTLPKQTVEEVLSRTEIRGKQMDIIKAIEKLIRKSPIPFVKISNRTAFATDLYVYYRIPLEYDDGVYSIVKSVLVPSDHQCDIEFPSFNEIKLLGVINTTSLLLLLRNATQFISKDECRLALTGIHFKITPGTLRVEASDGRILYANDVSFDTQIQEDSFILSNPQKVIECLIPFDGNVKMSYDETYVIFKSFGELAVPKIDESFPQTDKVWPTVEKEIVVNKDDLNIALKTIYPFVYDKGLNMLIITIEDNSLKLQDPKNRKEISLPAYITNVSYKPNKGVLLMPIREDSVTKGVAMNIEFLMKATKVLPDDTKSVCIGYAGPVSPIYVWEYKR